MLLLRRTQERKLLMTQGRGIHCWSNIQEEEKEENPNDGGKVMTHDYRTAGAMTRAAGGGGYRSSFQLVSSSQRTKMQKFQLQSGGLGKGMAAVQGHKPNPGCRWDAHCSSQERDQKK